MPDERPAIDLELRPDRRPVVAPATPPQVRNGPLGSQQAPSQPPRPPAARLLHGTPPSVMEQPRGAVLPTHSPFQANPGLRLAQLAALTQSTLAIITAVGLIRGTTSLAQLGAGVMLPDSVSLAANYGKGVAAIATVLILGAITVSVPSLIARSLLAILEIVMLGVTLAAHFGGGSVLGFVTVLTLGASGSAIVSFAGVVAMQSAVIYLLAIHPPTYRAFSEPRMPLT